jgi:hypothetical protein
VPATSDQRITSSQQRLERVIIGVLACTAVILALRLAHPNIIGHDDGIYAALGESLAKHGGYRLINLPSAPAETKYPPLYPALLTLVWLAVPSAPENILALKAVNALLLGVLAVLYWLAIRRVPALTALERSLSVAVFISLPGIFSFTDLLVSEQAFLVLLLSVILLAPTEGGSHSLVRLLAIGVFAGGAVLTRTVGAALVAGAIWHIWRSRGSRQAAVVFTAAAVVVAPWALWRMIMFDNGVGPLERYYVVYETSAWARTLRDPVFASRVIIANAAEYLRGIPVVFGLYGYPMLALGGVLSVAGAFSYPKRERALLGRVTACYCLLIIGHPLPMSRYLVPLVPVGALLFTAGTAAARRFLARKQTVAELAAILPLVALLAGNLAWLHHCASTRADGPQWHFGRRAAFEWSGFEEVFAWLKAHTPPHATIASAFDPVYFLYTGRRGVRPWIHEPERYTPAYGWNALPDSSPAVVAAELDALRVEYLIVDPMEGIGEGEHARRTVHWLLNDTSRWRLVFTTSDGAHRVYRRANRSALFDRALNRAGAHPAEALPSGSGARD